jgi:hypothetical protein
MRRNRVQSNRNIGWTAILNVNRRSLFWAEAVVDAVSNH